MRFWKAYDHRWGRGHTHVFEIDEESGREKTICGHTLESCPGEEVSTTYDCRACAKVLEARELRAARKEKWRAFYEQQKAQQQQENDDWWRWYKAYLQSPEWQLKSRLVIQRENGICQACGVGRATQAHHLTYEHVGHEPLFDLVAICRTCHERLTEEDRKRRAEARLMKWI